MAITQPSSPPQTSDGSHAKPADPPPPPSTSTENPTNTASNPAQPTSASKKSTKRKRKRKPTTSSSTPRPSSKHHHHKVFHSHSISLPPSPFSHIHLQHITSSGLPCPLPDALTAQMQLSAAMTQFLGMHGAAVPVDILRVGVADFSTALSGGEDGGGEVLGTGECAGDGDDDSHVWIRVPRQDVKVMCAAVGGWVSSSSSNGGNEGEGWRILGTSAWGAGGGRGRGGDGQELFE